MKKLFFAHSTPDTSRSDWQPLIEHCGAVGSIAGKYAAVFGAENFARTAGLLHDIGKYTEEFLGRLSGDLSKVDHTTRGAIVAKERYGVLGVLLAYVIAGHHAGLANGMDSGKRTTLHDRLRRLDLPPLAKEWEEIVLPQDMNALGDLPLRVAKERLWFQTAFFVRMLFSCVVDADYLDTEAFYDKIEAKGRALARQAEMPSLGALRERLDARLSDFRADSDVNKIRAEILAHVRQKAVEYSPGLFSLTVPTGGGKTLASLAFALDHAIKHGQRRVIFVIPFTSIVEQNAKVFREALGDLGEAAVLEHHSAYIASELSRDQAERFQSRTKLELAMENWDARIIVTTAVQFFESLFAARSSQCRKLHNIAGSVVILDEAQTLPLNLLLPSVAAIDELARNYKTSLVLCTATQPAWSKLGFKTAQNENAPYFSDLGELRELAPDPPALFRRLERVKVRHIGTLNDEELLGILRQHEQVLCIVNNRRHAQAVYAAMKAEGLSGARHLTTLMCSKHRSKALDEIRKDLKAGQPCRLVSTSLIEAGVDVDFPQVLRAEAGLDSVAQAAGRCNREGRRDIATSETLIFIPANEEWKPPPALKQFAQAATSIFRQRGEQGDLLAPDAIQMYFSELYWAKGRQALDKHDLLNKCKAPDMLEFEAIENLFRMIESAQTPVIVPYDSEARKALDALRHANKIGRFARDLQAYLIQVPRQTAEVLRASGAIQAVAPEKWGEQFMELVMSDYYDPDSGLKLDSPTFLPVESLHW